MERAARRALALLACTQFLLILDTAIINIAAPSIGGELDISASSLSWVANAYLVTFGGLQRFRSKDACPRFTGTAPTPVWSGSTSGRVRLTEAAPVILKL